MPTDSAILPSTKSTAWSTSSNTVPWYNWWEGIGLPTRVPWKWAHLTADEIRNRCGRFPNSNTAAFVGRPRLSRLRCSSSASGGASSASGNCRARRAAPMNAVMRSRSRSSNAASAHGAASNGPQRSSSLPMWSSPPVRPAHAASLVWFAALSVQLFLDDRRPLVDEGERHARRSLRAAPTLLWRPEPA